MPNVYEVSINIFILLHLLAAFCLISFFFSCIAMEKWAVIRGLAGAFASVALAYILANIEMAVLETVLTSVFGAGIMFAILAGIRKDYRKEKKIRTLVSFSILFALACLLSCAWAGTIHSLWR